MFLPRTQILASDHSVPVLELLGETADSKTGVGKEAGKWAWNISTLQKVRNWSKSPGYLSEMEGPRDSQLAKSATMWA